MNITESVKNIRDGCDNYIDADLVARIITDDYKLGSNNISEIEGYDISENDSYEEKFVKVLKNENIFLTFGMIAFIPVLNECDIFSTADETITITQKDFDENSKEKEAYFGILIKKDSTDYILGICDLCDCKIDSGFREVKNSDGALYSKLNEIIEDKLIF